MTKISKIRSVEILACDAGWRNYHFLKITTDDGVVGWSEFDEGFGSPGVGAAIERLSARVVGQNAISTSAFMPSFTPRPGRPRAAWSRRRSARSRTRCSTPRPRRSACRAMSCSAARCATASGSTGRIARPGASTIPTWYKPAITDLDGVKAIGAEVREKKFTALKTNIFIYDDGKPHGWRPGFGVPF